jgi:hypothetical protein
MNPAYKSRFMAQMLPLKKELDSVAALKYKKTIQRK